MGAIISIAIASSIASGRVEDLKRQINEIIARHKPISDAAQRLQKHLQSLNFNEAVKGLMTMSETLSHNLETIIGDQQIKLQMLEKIDIGKFGEDPKSWFENFLDIANLVLTVFSVIQFMCMTNPVTAAISGVLLIISAIFELFALIKNLQLIEDLKKKKAELELYYQPGGQFDQELEKLCKLCVQIVENFYMFIATYRNIMNELAINFNLLLLSDIAKQKKYVTYLDLLCDSLIDAQFENQCLLLYKKILSIQNRTLEQRVNMSCKYLDEFESKNKIYDKLDSIHKVALKFNKQSDIGQEFTKASDEMKRLTTLRDRFVTRFEKRKGLDKKELPQCDEELFDDMMDQARKMQYKELSVVEVVSFFTTEFYADDPTGQTLCKMNLKEVSEKTDLLGYLGSATGKPNIIYMPRPENEELNYFHWDYIQQRLDEWYRLKYGNAQYQFKKLYTRIQNSKFTVAGEQKSKLDYYYGMTYRTKSSNIDETLQLQCATLIKGILPHLPTKSTNAMEKSPVPVPPTSNAIERIEETNEDLNSLCNYMNFFINAFAFPERVVKFQIEKVGDKYKGILEWQNQRIKPDYFGKIVKYDIVPKGSNSIGKFKNAQILNQKIFDHDENVVVFSFK